MTITHICIYILNSVCKNINILFKKSILPLFHILYIRDVGEFRHRINHYLGKKLLRKVQLDKSKVENIISKV